MVISITGSVQRKHRFNSILSFSSRPMRRDFCFMGGDA